MTLRATDADAGLVDAPALTNPTVVEPSTPNVRGLVFLGILAAVSVAVVTLAFLRLSGRRAGNDHYAPPMPMTVDRVPPLILPTYPMRPPARPWERHLPSDLPTLGSKPAILEHRGQLLTQAQFDSQTLSGSIFAGAYLLQATFEKSDLTDADFRGADLSQANFAGATLTRARFDEARIHQTGFIGVDSASVSGQTRVRNGITEPVPPPALPVKEMGKATFRRTRFSQVTLDDLDLAGGQFTEAEFQGVTFRNADLRGADFSRSQHQITDFSGAKLDGANFYGADLSSARNLTAEQLRSARTDYETRLPPLRN